MKSRSWKGTTLGVAAVGAALLWLACSNSERSEGVPVSSSLPKEYVIGCIAPMTGDNQDYGSQTKRGAALAAEQINAAGGINGVPLRMIYEDDEGTAKGGASALQKLASVDKVPVVLGPFLSTIVLAVAPQANRDHVILLSASATADAIRESGDYVFRIVPPNRRQGETAATFALTKLNARRAAVVAINDDYGKTLTEAFVLAFERGGGKVVIVEPFNRGTTDFRSLITKVAGASPDIVFFPGNYQETGTLLRQARQQNLAMPFVGTDGQVGSGFLEVAGQAAEGTYYTDMGLGGPEAKDQTARFREAFRKRYDVDPSTFEAYAFDAVHVIASAIQRGGYGVEGLKTALYGTKGLVGVSGTISFDDHGEVDKQFSVKEVRDGAFWPVT